MNAISATFRGPHGASRFRWFYLVYLIIYPIPWFYDGFHTLDIVGSGVGLIAFLAIYLSYAPLQPAFWQGWAIAGIAFAMAPFHGIWTVFIVYASAAFAGYASRNRAVASLVFVLLILGLFCWWTHRPWPDAVFGASFSIASFAGTSLTTDLARRHRQLLETQEEVRHLAASTERERIARDLHDLLGHSLTVIAVKAELAERLNTLDSSRSRREIQEIAETARQSLREVRAAVAGMHGASLPREVAQAESSLRSAGIRMQLSGDPEAVDVSQDGILAMALREAVTNIIRHTKAAHCTIRLQQERSKTAVMIIEDDGQTYVPVNARKPLTEGHGLRGMRSRLAAAGGALHIEQGTKGLRVTARLGASS